MATTQDPFGAPAAQRGALGASGPRAGFWQRFGAALLDSILLAVIDTLVRLVVSGSAGLALTVLINIAYFVALEGGPTGQTLGKRALGIRVVSFDTGGPIGYPRAFVRYLGRIVSFVVILLGYLWMLWDREKQCWHDKMAADVVVPTTVYPVGPREADPPYPGGGFAA